MMGSPLFSVILCTFNRAHLLPRALDSLLAQQETDWEALIIDDGSTDHTAQVVELYLRRTSQLRYAYHSNQGLALSRNMGACLAKGEFLTFLDSDDWLTPDHLAVRKQALQQNPTADFLHGGTQIIGDPYVADRDDPSTLVHLDQCIIDATFVIRRRLFWSLGGFPALPYSAGNALYERAVQAGIRPLRISALTYVYDRTTPDSICSIAAQGGIVAIEQFRKGRWLPPTSLKPR